MADTGRTVFADGLWADDLWAAGLWATDAPVIVPDVDDPGTSQAAAIAAIEAEGLVAAVNTAYSSTVPVGEVISQSPAAGSSVAPGSTVTITVSLGPQSSGAGRSKTRKHRYVVEIDGQIFHAEDTQHAMAILDHAAELAHKAAAKQADAIASKIKKARRIGLAIPKVTTTAPIDLAPYRERIRTAYKNAAIEAEMRMHLAWLAQREDEEAAAVLLLM